MFLGICKISFDPESTIGVDGKSVKALIEGLRARFKTSVAATSFADNDGDSDYLVATLVHRDEKKLQETFEAVAKFCEDKGFARVDDCEIVIDLVESFLSDGV